MQRTKLITLLVITFLLVSCSNSSDTGSKPVIRPSGDISGSGTVFNAEVRVYEFNGGKGTELVKSTSDEAGYFGVSLKASNKPLVVCLSDGTLKEAASDVLIGMTQGDELCSVFNYVSGVKYDISINYFSHIAYALAVNSVANSVSENAAITDANRRVSKLLGFSVTETKPNSITDITNGSTLTGDKQLFGVAIAAVSQFTADLNIGNSVAIHSTFNSNSFAQVAFDDLSADGVFDGLGFDNTQPLSFSSTQVDVTVYRASLAKAMFSAIRSNYNKTGLSGKEIKLMVDKLNLSTDLIFGGVSALPFELTPDVVIKFDSKKRYSGKNEYSFTIDDVYGLENVVITINGVPVSYVIVNGVYIISFDTASLPDGVYPFIITATNIYGKETVTTTNIEVFNTPDSTYSGKVFDGLILQGNLNIYEFIGGTKGSLLASTTTDLVGLYSVTVSSHEMPVLPELDGGRYIEEASGRNVVLQASNVHKLRAMLIHKPGVPINTSVTTWTNIAAGLAQYRMSQGLDVTTAIISANFDMSSLLGFNILTTEPKDITDIKNAAPLTPELEYGFIAGGLSQWTFNNSVFNNENPTQTAINSINFSMVAYEDIKADGLLDGRGAQGTILTFANKPITANTYRHDIALGIIQIVGNIRNKTGLSTLDLIPTAKRLNDSPDPIFGSLAIIPLDESGPIISNFSPLPTALNSGTFTVTGSVTDLLGLTQVELLINGVSKGLATNPANFSFSIDSGLMDDCNCIFTIRATNINGTVTESIHKVQVDNRRFVYFKDDTYSSLPFNGSYSYNRASSTSLNMGNIGTSYPLAMHPSGKYAYFTSSYIYTLATPLKLQIIKYDLDPVTGLRSNPVVVTGSPAVPAGDGRSFHFSRDGKYFFEVVDGTVFRDGTSKKGPTASFIITYSVGVNGGLTRLSQSGVSAGPIMMAFHPSKNIVYIPQWKADTIGIYKIQANGSLIALAGAPTISGNSPRFVAVDKKGTYAYVVYGLENTVKKYRFSPEGWLILDATYSTGGTPRTIQIHNSGKSLYVANYDGTLSVFNISLTNGVLTQAGGSPIRIYTPAAGYGLRGMYLDKTSENAVFWGTFGAYIAPISSNGAVGARSTIFSNPHKTINVFSPLLTIGVANAP